MTVSYNTYMSDVSLVSSAHDVGGIPGILSTHQGYRYKTSAWQGRPWDVVDEGATFRVERPSGDDRSAAPGR